MANDKAPNLDLVLDLLTALRNSCEEALDGTWDHTTSEGEEGFLCMARDCENIAKELGLNLPPYEPKKEEEE